MNRVYSSAFLSPTSPSLTPSREKVVVFCGGTERPAAKLRLERHLHCQLIWARTAHHKSPHNIDNVLRVADAVLLWYGGTSHVLAGHLNDVCRQPGMPALVRLRAGYGATQVEAAIRAQAPHFFA